MNDIFLLWNQNQTLRGRGVGVCVGPSCPEESDAPQNLRAAGLGDVDIFSVCLLSRFLGCLLHTEVDFSPS